MNIFPLHATDAYKLGHRAMYQPGTGLIYSNFTPRNDKLFKGSKLYDHKMVVFGIQGFIKEFLIECFNEQFFALPKAKAVSRYKRRMDTFMGVDVIPVDGVEALHDLGYLPIAIKALPEGVRVRMGVPVLTIYNTHADFAWMVNYLETVLSSSIWKPMVNATVAFEYRRVLDHYAEMTGTPDEAVMWQGHDFSARGMSGPEDAARCGAAHLLSFAGSDTVSAVDYLEDYYGADAEKELVAASVPATEHSVSSTNILYILYIEQQLTVPENDSAREWAEIVFLREYITKIVPTGIASYVADTYDYYGVLTNILPVLRDDIMARDGKLVVRPDSGDPVEVICGLPETAYNRTRDGVAYPSAAWDGAAFKGGYDPIPEAVIKGSIELLWDTFGGTVTENGYKMLDSHIGLIYGDSITIDRMQRILEGLEAKGFASGNVVFGVGSYTYNYSTRDTFGSAVKATATEINEDFIEIFKDPKTGAAKKSAKGLLAVREVGGELTLFDQQDWAGEADSLLELVFENGRMVKETTLAEIRNRLGGL